MIKLLRWRALTAVLSPRIWLLGAGAGAAVHLPAQPMLILMAILAAPQVWQAIAIAATAKPPSPTTR
jgi:hypothetical protein